MRTHFDAPIIMLAARADERDHPPCLGAAADDYIGKPFSPKEVVARVRAMRRRPSPNEAASDSGRLAVDAANLSASFDGKAMRLTPVEWRLLSTLVAQPGVILTRTKLLETLYADHRVVTTRAVDTHIKNLRSMARC